MTDKYLTDGYIVPGAYDEFGLPTKTLPVDYQAPNYVIEPDLLEAQQGAHLPTGIAYNDAGIPFNIKTGQEIPTVPRPRVLPVAKTPDGFTFAMPKVLDLFGNMMGGVAGAPVKGAEVLLGSGPVRKAASAVEVPKVNPLEYRGTHTAPQKDAGATLDNVSNIYPDDIYSPNGARYYGHGGDDVGMDQKTISIMNQFKNKPNADVTIYRAVPYEKSASEKLNILNEQMRKYMRRNTIPKGEEHLGSKWYDDAVDRRTGLEMAAKVEQKGEPLNINGGDWVTINRDYAKQHGESALRGNYKIISKKVKASDLGTDGNSIHEWGYNPTLLSDTRNQVYSEIGRQLEKGPFFSALERAVDTAKLNKGDAQQWLGYLKNQPGVKSEELAYVLGDLKGQLTKAEVQDIIKGNKVELGEVVKKPNDGSREVFLDEAAEEIFEQPFDDLSVAQRNQILDMVGDKGLDVTDATKYHFYQLPGGERYQEMLLTLPSKKGVPPVIEKNEFGQYQVEFADGSFEGYPTLKEAQQAAKEFDLNSKHAIEAPLFKSSHWDEPNIIAHVRMNDRVIPQTGYSVENKVSKNSRMFNSKEEAETFIQSLPENLKGQIKIREVPNWKGNKKTLHLEEIQSDWHQKGRAEGYKLSDKQKADLEAIEGKLTEKLTEAEIGNPDIENVLKVAVDKKIITSDEAKNYKDYVKGENSTVPDAPFKKNWDEVALKRMLHKAAVEGYEGISWTPGEAQALRYQNEVRQKLKTIDWDEGRSWGKHRPDGRIDLKRVHVDGEMGTTWLDVDKNSNIVHAQHKELKDKSLDVVVGKDLAKQIMEKTTGSIDAKGYVMGAEGMKGFYDEMLVSKANALAKKYGSKVESKEIKAAPKYEIKNPLLNKKGEEIVSVYKDGVFQADMEKSEATSWIAKKKETDKASTIHYLPITPELRQKAKSGFPLFSSVPVTTPIDFDPFANDRKQPKLTPVDYDPFQ